MPAFFLFSQDKRAEAQEMVKSARGKPWSKKAWAVPKMLGRMWNDMKPSEKKAYKAQAKEQYDAAVNEEIRKRLVHERFVQWVDELHERNQRATQKDREERRKQKIKDIIHEAENYKKH